MSMKRRSPLVLVSTTAAVESILGRSRGSETPDVNASATCDSLSKGLVNGNENSRIVLTAGLLLWQGAKSTSVSSSGCLDPTALQDMIQRRHGGKDSGIFDESLTVGVSATVLKSLSLTSGSWVTIKDMVTSWAKPARVMVLDPPEKYVPHLGSPQELRQDYSNTKSFPFYCLVGGNSQQLDPEVAYLSPVLAFNLGIYVSWLEFLTSVHDLDSASKPARHDASGGVSNLQKVATSSCSWCYLVEISPFLAVPQRSFCEITNEQNGALPHITRRAHLSQSIYATHMRIGLIRIPTEITLLPPMKRRQAQIDASLQDYFKIDRFLARGDVFSIQLGLNVGPSDSHNTDMFSGPATPPKVEFLFFKVLALEPSTETVLCANHNHTALVLGGSVASQLPPLSRATHLQKVFLRTPAVQQLTSLLAPCLHPRVLPLDLRLSVLLHGPSGSGKQTVVRLAAEDLGVHVVEYNCYDFVGASEGKTAAALMNAFKTAKRYSPSLLLLRWFGALGKSSAGVSPGDQQGAISRVISVLKTCIAAHLPSSSPENYNDAGEWLFGGELTDLVKKEPRSIPVKFAGMESGNKDGLVLVIATCENAESLTPALRRCFTHEVTIGMPNEDQRLTLLHHYLGVAPYQNNGTRNILGEGVTESLKVIAAQTSGLTPRDLHAVAADAGACAITRSARGGQLRQEGTANSLVKHLTDLKSAVVSNPSGELVINVQDVVDNNQSLAQVSAKDLETVLEKVKTRTASAIGTPKVPNVKWEDVGGLEDVKKAILDTVQLPLIHRELFSSGLRQRSGVLLYGPPGTGKTLLAKAVATECALNFLSVKGPELINMYIGESEKNVREIFQKARTARPCVVFFDELDALAPARGASGDSGGVMDRVVSQMLAEIDGVSENSQDLFIIGASNRPDLIDPALLRPGRFDKLLYVGVSSENSYRERVLEALTRKFRLHKNVSLKALAQRCPVTYTGADMYALCADAWQQAVKREISTLEGRKGSSSITSSEIIVVKEEDFIKAMGELMPSLSQAELDRYERLRVQFEGK